MEVKGLFPKKNCLGCPLALLKCLPLFIILPDTLRSSPRETVAIYMKAYMGSRWMFYTTIKSVFLLQKATKIIIIIIIINLNNLSKKREFGASVARKRPEELDSGSKTLSVVQSLQLLTGFFNVSGGHGREVESNTATKSNS